MGRTFLRQDAQIRQSVTYDDTLAAGATLESAPVNIEEDLNGLRSQAKRAIFADAAGDWYADIPTVNGKKRAISALNTDLDDLEEKRILFRTNLLTDITVTAGQNYAVLSQAASETPSQVAAVNGGTALGAVVASLAADVGSHSLNEVSGPDAISPKNLLLIRDAGTGQPIQSASGKDIYGLLQVETGVVDGDAFNDTNHQAQISFVIENAGGTDLIACPVADIENKTINYSYVRRINFDAIPEYIFLSGAFLDESATADITLDRAIDNQSGPATQAQNIRWQIADGVTLDFEDPSGARNLLSIQPTGGGDTIALDIDTLDINNVNDVDMLNGLSVDTGGTPIDIGSAAGVIATRSTSDLRILGAGELYLDDGNQTGSTWAQTNGIKLSDTTAEWDNFETEFGEVSLLRAIYLAATGSARARAVAVVVSNIAANTLIQGPGVAGTDNIDVDLLDYRTVTFLTDIEIFINGQLMRNGADASANHDVYPSAVSAEQQFGAFYAEFALHASPGNPDVIQMFRNG